MKPMQISPRLSSFSGNSITFTTVSLRGPRFALGVSTNGRFHPAGLIPRFWPCAMMDGSTFSWTTFRRECVPDASLPLTMRERLCGT